MEKLLAERSLHEYVKQAWEVVEPEVEFIDGWHVRALCEHLQHLAVEKKPKFRDLLVNVPPGTMKSLLTSVFLPTWVWGPLGKPHTRWMFASYSGELSTRDSIKRRIILNSPWYQERWAGRVAFSKDQNLKTRYENLQQGWMYSTSVCGGGTGEHPDFIIIDDPHNVKQAESELERQQAIDWIDGTIGSRGVVRGVKKIVVMQRLHEYDASGYLIKKGGWTHLCLPMRYEPNRMVPTPLGWNDPRKEEGELLWPEGMPEEAVQQLERMGEYWVAGQLQQRPAPLGGGMFKRLWYPIVDTCPKNSVFLRYWDKAASHGKGAFSVGVLMARHSDSFYVVDVVRGQWSSHERNEVMKQVARNDNERYGWVRVAVEQEGGSGGKESLEITIKLLAGYEVLRDRPSGDKETRARPFAGMGEAGGVRLVEGPWNEPFLAELCTFPYGRFKDQVDAASACYNLLALGPNETYTDEIIDEYVRI